MTAEQTIIQVALDLPSIDYRLKIMDFEGLQALTGLDEASLVTALNNLRGRGLLFNGYIDDETGEVVTSIIGNLYKLNNIKL